MSHQDNDSHYLTVPFFGTLDAIGYGEYEDNAYFNTGTLFWSLTRLFGYYERVISSLELPPDERPFLEADIEGFIVRFRIVLNDIAYVIRQLLPKNIRGLKGPTGSVHPNNQEMSFFTLADFLSQKCATYPELYTAFSKALAWTTRLKHDRDNVIHYKSKVVIFEGDHLSFAFMNAARTHRIEVTPDGGEKLLLEPVMGFVNDQMLALHGFMHKDLALAIQRHASRLNLKLVGIGSNHRMICVGIQRFKRINALSI